MQIIKMADQKSTFVKLNNSNYFNWKFRMEMFLVKEKLWKIVLGNPMHNPGVDASSTQTSAYNTWIEKDESARAIIGLHVEDDQYGLIRGKSTAKEFWNALKEQHEKDSFGNKVTLMRRICSRKMGDDESMEEHIKQFNESFQRLDDLGEESLPERWRIALIMTSLPKSYDSMISALEMRREDELTMNLVQSKLLDEYHRRHENEDSTKGESVLRASERKTTCFFCKREGHMKKDCQKFKSWKQKKQTVDKVNVSKEPSRNESAELLFALSAFSHDSWIVDSGATSHITGNKEFFVSLDDEYRGEVDLADGTKVNIIGKGTCAIKCVNNKGNVITANITDVLYSPKIGGNLLSVSKLAHKGFTLKFNKSGCELIQNNKQIAALDECNNLYKLRQPDVICAAKVLDKHGGCLHYWHRVFGHRDPKAIKEMIKGGLIEGAELIECSCQGDCEVCLKAKLTRLPFPHKATNHSKAVLELVHTDVCGPMQTASNTGKRYVLTLIDDFSKFTVISLLSHKSEVEARIKDYIGLVNNKFGRKPKIFRSDRGGEYLGNEFKAYLRKEGIEQQLTTARTPQQNGTAERKNRTLIEMARCMLTDAQLPNMFWAEAVNAANYIQNRVLTRSTNRTPYELWYERRADTRHMNIFGSKCFVHVSGEERRKLDNTATEMILVGYDEQSKAYRCYDMVNRKVKISRDVRFVGKAVQQETAVEIDTCGKNSNKGEIDDNMGNNSLNENADESDIFDDCTSSLDNTLVQADDSDEQSIDTKEGDHKDDAKGPRRSRRPNKGIPPVRFNDYVCSIVEPKTLAQALSSDQKQKWVEAMDEEIKSLAKNGTWNLCELPSGRTAIGSKWVYKAKTDAAGEICRYKARLVAQGFSQKYGIDYDQVFAPVVRQTTFRILLSIASVEGLCVKHLDAKTAFLNGKLKELIYMRQPPGYEDGDKPNLVCQLKKSLYGLKQAARSWNEEINDILIGIGFHQSNADACLYSKHESDGWVYLLIYVDDMIIAAKSNVSIDRIRMAMQKKVDIQDLGNIKHYLGMGITKDSGGIYHLCQATYINQVMREFGLQDAKVSSVPISVGYGKDLSDADSGLLLSNSKYQQLLGCLLYISVNTRPDIAAAVAILAQRTCRPRQEDWNELKRVLRYLKGTVKMKLALAGNNKTSMLFGYADANWAEDKSDRKSNSGFVFIYNGGIISWMCRKQTCVALSSTEAEFVALSEACQEAIWIRKVLLDLNQAVKSPTLIYEDNQSCLKLISGEKLSNRTKHIDTKKHFVRSHVDNGNIECKYCQTEEMVADLLTKPLSGPRVEKLRKMCGLND